MSNLSVGSIDLNASKFDPFSRKPQNSMAHESFYMTLRRWWKKVKSAFFKSAIAKVKIVLKKNKFSN